MIIWINGAFGVGKTQTAYELQYQIANSMIYDPEKLGYFLGKCFPKDTGKSDFQDYRSWRISVSAILAELAANSHKIIIVPMTIVNEDYFHEIVDPLMSAGHQFHNFTCTTLLSLIMEEKCSLAMHALTLRTKKLKLIL